MIRLTQIRCAPRRAVAALSLAALGVIVGFAAPNAGATSTSGQRQHSWQEVQSFILNATGIGLVHSVGHVDANGRTTRIEVLQTKDQDLWGPIFEVWDKRFGFSDIEVYSHGNLSGCWKGWQAISALKMPTRQSGAVHWIRTPYEEAGKPVSWAWVANQLYGNVCVSISVGKSRQLPAGWFRLEDVMSKLR